MEHLTTKQGKTPVLLVTVFVTKIQVDFQSTIYPDKPKKDIKSFVH